MDFVYLDNNATTRPADEVVAAMMPFYAHWWGNPSSVHRFGQRARQAIDEARAHVAALIGCSDSELLFTGGGTESINTAIRGLLGARGQRRKIVTTSVEHSATKELCAVLANEGAAHIITIGVDTVGRLDLEALQNAINDDPALLTLLWANNETGVIFPLERIAAMCKEKRVPLHVDATQAIGKIPVDAKAFGVDSMSFASHKFHGPKGVGGLFVRKGLRIKPLMIGGPQERNRRGGTENVPGIVGMGKAAELAMAHLAEMPRVAMLRDRLEAAILAMPHTSVNGDREHRLPNTTNVGFSQLEAEAILLLFSERGLCASAGSACSSGSLEPSHVLRAMKIEEKFAHGAVRFSLSRETTTADIDKALAIIPPVIERLRNVLPGSKRMKAEG